MSDCFDHALDAFGSLGQDHQDTSSYTQGNLPVHRTYDPLHYHKKHKVKLIQQTEQAYQFENKKGVFWVAKKLCRKLDESKGCVYIWRRAKISYITQEKKQ